MPLRILICLLVLSLWIVSELPIAHALTVANPTAGEDAAHPHAEAEQQIEKDGAEPEDTAEEDNKESDADENEQAAEDDAGDEDDADDDYDESKEDEEQKTHKVESKPFRIEETLDGLFVATETKEVELRPETWTKFKVVEAVPHGARVQQGDLLVRFDDEQLEQELADEAIAQRLSELALMKYEEEYPRTERLREIAYEQARLAHEQLVEDFEYYKNTDRPFSVEIAHYRYNAAKEDLASQEEELAQLEKMYAADDLTEETEAIVLRRQRFQVATAKLNLELREANRDYTLNVTLPRYDQDYRDSLEKSKLALEQAKTAKEKGAVQAKYELEQKRVARAKSIERHAKLISDKSLMELRAPAEGVVYYGRNIDGKWSEVGTLAKKLQPHSSVTANSVLMTIVQQRPLVVTAQVAEKNLTEFEVGQQATITPSADDKLELEGKVVSVGSIPDAGGKYPVRLEVDLSDAPAWLVAGMNCDAKVTVYESQDAMVIPTSLLQTEESDDSKKYVMIVGKDGKEVRRDVKLGREQGDEVEVLSGLEPGEEIVEPDDDDAEDE